MAMMHEMVKASWYPQGAIKTLHLVMLQTSIQKKPRNLLGPSRKILAHYQKKTKNISKIPKKLYNFNGIDARVGESVMIPTRSHCHMLQTGLACNGVLAEWKIWRCLFL